MSTERAFIQCTACGKLNSVESHRDTCWLCHEILDTTNIVSRNVETDPASAAESGGKGQFAFATLLMAVMGVICVGAFLRQPGVGIALALLSIIPMIRTMMVVSRRSQEGEATSMASKVIMFFSSMAVTWIILTVVGVAAFGAFCLTCLGAYSVTDSEELAIPIAGGAALIVVGGLGIVFWKWIDSRWRRDTRQE